MPAGFTTLGYARIAPFVAQALAALGNAAAGAGMLALG
jgi:hypothetical protein